MTLLQAALLGILQGLTEFLPVSSSGHLVLAQALLGVRETGVAFEVTVHLATLCAVLWVFRARVGRVASGAVRGERSAWRYIGLLVLASVPAAVVGLGFEAPLEATFDRPVLAALALLVTGGLVWSIRWTGRTARDEEPDAGQAAWIGIAQALAILPGISRSGSTVAAGAWRGVALVPLAEFSFLLSVPAILGAGLLKLPEISADAATGQAAPLAVGFLLALAAGILAIRLFLVMLRARSFHYFAWYCWAVGGGYLVAAAFLPGLR